MYLVLGIPLRERQKQGSIMSVGASEKTDIMDVLKPVVEDLRNCERYNYTPVFRQDVLWYGDIRLSVGLCVVFRRDVLWYGDVRLQTGRIMVWWYPSSDRTYYGMVISVFRRDVLWYGDIRLQTGRIMVWWCPSSDRTYYGMVISVFRRDVLWYGDIRLQTGRIMVWWCPSVCRTLRPSGYPPAGFQHFSPTCFDTLSWNFAHDFVLMHFRASLSVVTLCQFLKELCLFVNLEYRKCAVFRTFLLHALRYWAEILHMIMF